MSHGPIVSGAKMSDYREQSIADSLAESRSKSGSSSTLGFMSHQNRTSRKAFDGLFMDKYIDNSDEVETGDSADSDSSQKVINTERLTSNIRELLKAKDAKIGQIEKDAGVQPGYLSRFEKDTSKTPTLDFVYTAAKDLGVTVNCLIECDFSNLTDAELYILNFINKLINGTNHDDVHWDCQSPEEFCNVGFHPLVTELQKKDGRIVKEFDSQMHMDGHIFPIENIFYYKLKGTESVVYITKLAIMDSAVLDDIDAEIVAMYIVNQTEKGHGEAKRICDSLQTAEPIQKSLEELFDTLMLDSTHLHIDDETKNAIDTFMGLK